MSWALQWGRNFIVAEIGILVAKVGHRVDASMGPQLYRCGNVKAGRDAMPPVVRASMGPQLYRCGNKVNGFPFFAYMGMLQWGRNFIVAET